MAAIGSQSESKSLLEDLDALVDQSIDAMTPAQLRKFRRDRKKIMRTVIPRGSASPAPRENAESERPVLRA